MVKTVRTTQQIIFVKIFFLYAIFLNNVYAAPAPAPSIPAGVAAGALLPGSVLPEVAGSNLATPQSTTPQSLPPLPKQKPEQLPNKLGEAATKIRFILTKIILKGNTVYSDSQLAPVYRKKIGTTITVSQLQDIVQDLTNYYRNAGYILSRAILPPQHVNNGVVIIQIVEGYIDNVRVIGAPHGARALVQRYGDRIALERPLQIKTMEHYLLLVNNIPSVQVKAVLEPSKTNIGASDLDLVTQTKTFSGYTSYDNYGTRYNGPTEVSVGTEMDSVFVPGDSTQINITRTTRPQELKYFSGTYNIPIGVDGMRLLLSGSQSITLPEYVLTPVKIYGDAVTLYTQLQYPLIRTRSNNLTLDSTFNYIDSKVTAGEEREQLYNDHLRTVRVGVNFDNSDTWYGSNNIGAHAEQGLEFLGATTIAEGYTGQTSRFGASGHFTKLDLQFSRLQQFGASRYAAYFIVSGQYALEPLLATEQFAFGGVQQALGRGYDPAEIIGDRGLASSIELRLNTSPGRWLLQAAQFFVFYDAGVIWNVKNVADQATKQSATSAGFGARFFFTKNVSGNVLWAQPLTRQVSALSLIGDGRQPRIFFSMTASI